MLLHIYYNRYLMQIYGEKMLNVNRQHYCNVFSFYYGYRFRSRFRPSFTPFAHKVILNMKCSIYVCLLLYVIRAFYYY